MEKYKKILLALVILLAGCTKNFLDVNTDPNNPSKATLGLLLTHVEKSIADGLDVYGGLGNITPIWYHWRFFLYIWPMELPLYRAVTGP
jgi:hypothetical protein